MTTKEALKRIIKAQSVAMACLGGIEDKKTEQAIDIVKKDLERLEKLEKENQELKEKFKMLEENEEAVLTTLEIAAQENTKLNKALEKSCEKLEYACPVEEELTDDLDCEHCQDNYKECWKKYFMKKAIDNMSLEDDLIRCPYCGKSYYKINSGCTTTAYYTPVYKDGVNVNPDRNKTTYSCTCLNCGKDFSFTK